MLWSTIELATNWKQTRGWRGCGTNAHKSRVTRSARPVPPGIVMSESGRFWHVLVETTIALLCGPYNRCWSSIRRLWYNQHLVQSTVTLQDCLLFCIPNRYLRGRISALNLQTEQVPPHIGSKKRQSTAASGWSCDHTPSWAHSLVSEAVSAWKWGLWWACRHTWASDWARGMMRDTAFAWAKEAYLCLAVLAANDKKNNGCRLSPNTCIADWWARN